jgi:hypothetical protein
MNARDTMALGYAADPVTELVDSTPYRPIGLLGRGGMGEVRVITWVPQHLPHCVDSNHATTLRQGAQCRRPGDTGDA